MRDVGSMPSMGTGLLLLLALVVGACSDEAPLTPPDRLVDVSVVMSPSSGPHRLGDTLTFTVEGGAGRRLAGVRWSILPEGGPPVESETLVWEASTSGRWWIRGEAEFEDGSAGADTRMVDVRPNSAPTVTIEPVTGMDFSRMPLGDTLHLAATIEDPEGDEFPPERVEWLLTGTEDDSLLTQGDTLVLHMAEPGSFDIALRVTDPHGATSVRRFPGEFYDPISPPAWRARVGGRYAFHGLTETRSGAVLVGGRNSMTALSSDGEQIWEVELGSDPAEPVPAGPSGNLYLAGEDLVALTPGGEELWRISREQGGGTPDLGPMVLEDGTLIDLAGDRVLRWITPEGELIRSVTLAEMNDVTGMGVGLAGRIYVGGRLSGSPPVELLLAYSDAGEELWSRELDPEGTYPASLVPVGDQAVLFSSDSLYAFSADGEKLWAAPDPIRQQPAVGGGLVFAPGSRGLRALRLSDGGVQWEAAHEGFLSSPVLTADGRVFVATRREVLGFDSLTGELVYRHRLASEHWGELLLTTGGLLVVVDQSAFVEALDVGSSPLDSPWPMPWGGPYRLGRGGGG